VYESVKPSDVELVGAANVTPAWTIPHSSLGVKDHEEKLLLKSPKVTEPKFANG
jgi:hypothetical protein